MRWLLVAVCLSALACAAEEHECEYCEPNTYCFVERQHQCPAHSLSPAGSDDAADCVCKAGFYLDQDLEADDASRCRVCDAHHYCPGGLEQLRRSCPQHAESVSGATHAGMCLCSAGFTHEGEETPFSCVACPAGTIKSAAGNVACVACDAHHYSLSTLECRACPQLTQSAPGSADVSACVSTPGAYMHAGAAKACPPGTYQDEVNSTSCKQCPANTYQPTHGADAPAACLPCPALSHSDVGSANVTACRCDAGSAGKAGGLCSPCTAGTVATHPNTEVCAPCPLDSYSGAGASSCIACPAHSTSPTGSELRHCTCTAGFAALAAPFACAACAPGSAKTAGNAQCLPCAAGTFAPDNATHECQLCPANTYSNLGSSACTPCAANEFSASASDSIARCLCVAGFFRPAGFDGAPQHERAACAQCPYGTFRNVTHAQHWGSLACQACPPGTSTAVTGATSVAACAICPAGFFIVDAGHLEGACVPCGAHAGSVAGTRGGCLCAAGFEPGAGADAALCVACTYGHYKSLAGNHSCTACAAGKQGVLTLGAAALGEEAACELCPADTHWKATGTPCTPCHANSEAQPGATSADDCLCKPGFEHRPHSLAGVSTMACSACDPGFAKAASSNVAFCTPCSGLLYSHSPGAVACEHCPPHSAGGHANDADVDCLCDPGFSGPNGGPCPACAVGKYKLQQGSDPCLDCGPNAFWPPGADPTANRCEPCPQHSTRGSDLHSGVLGCVCDSGYQRAADDQCSICPAGSYCPEQHALLQCPPHSFSSAGSAALLDCLCVAGYHGAAGNCSACPVDAFCETAAVEPAPCPANSSTLGLAQRTNVSACVCLPGFYRATDAFGHDSCRQCERDSFCFNDRQVPCPANSSAPPGADSVSHCVCHDGTAFEPRAVAHVCTPCGPAQVCRRGVVTSCAAGALNANFRCVCAAGSFCTETTLADAAVLDLPQSTCLSTCSACPHNSWCADNKRTECSANEGAPANSSAPCRCFDGFFRNHLGACVECPLHHVCINETRRAVADFDPGLRTLATRRVFLSEAVCAPGLFRTSKTDLCKLCPKGFYCPQEASPAAAPTAVALPNVVRCPANEFTASRGASSRSQCVCGVGFKLAEHEATAKCLPCAAGERCQGGAVLEIECHLENKAISADHSACVCEVGFGLLDFECQQCPRGFVKPVIGDTPCVPCGIDEYAVNSSVCVSCPQHAEARPGSAKCTCAPPYALRDGACALCPADHYWTQAGCVACPPESSSQPTPTMQLGPAACRCARGHHTAPKMVASVLRCEVCPAGTFERSGACMPCPEGAWAPPKSHSVDACVCNALPGANSTCHALRIDGTCAGVCASTPPPCAACSPGHYKATASTPGNTQRCLACGEGQYQPASAALSCETCPLYEWHTELAATARSQCLCVGGWTREGATQDSKLPCAACNAGFYKDWLGDGICAPCAVGSYNPHTNATSCYLCSDAGLELLLAAASARPVLESNTTAQLASVSVLQCVCDHGHEPRQAGASLHCRPCAPGSFKDHADHHDCAYCGAANVDRGTALLHHFGAPASGAVAYTHCLSCPAFSGQDHLAVGPGLIIMDQLDDCKCFPGHENRSDSGCSACRPYMVQTSYSDDACSFCPAGHYFVERHTPCAACYLADDGGAPHELLVLNRNDPSMPWGADAGDCICRLGYERDAADLCRACAAGHFRGSNGTRWCAQCPVDTFQDATAAHECNRCPPNSSTLLATGQPAVQGCVCAAGFQQLQHVPASDAFLCLPCAAGTYRPSRLANESEQACVQCPTDHFCPAGAVLPSPCPPGELALPGATDIDHCLCPPGSGRTPGPAHAPHELSNPCILCAHAFFAPTSGNTPCAPCPANKNTSAPGATALADCTCVPGHGVAPSTQHASHDAFLAAACAPCTDGFFAPGGRSAPCTHCGWGAVTEPASAASSASNCQCNALNGLFNTNTQ